jgi:Bacterial TSP3 repeat
MNDAILRRLRLALAAVALVALLVMPATASAKRHHTKKNADRNHNSIPDKWEKKFHLRGKGVAKADPDKDGLNNLAEFRSKTNPRKADSNGNGVPDAGEDADHDGVDNGNEAREGTNPGKGDSNGNGVKDGKEDADKDKLNNAGEDQAGTDPINPDTDGDGIKDGDEKAGEIVSFDGTTLTLRLFGGQTISGTVDENTWIDCASADSSSGDNSGDWWDDSSSDPSADELKVRASRLDVSGDPGASDPGADDPNADDPGADDPGADDPGADDPGADDPSVDDGSGDPSVDDGSGGCSTDVLKVGAAVSEADFSATSDGLFYDSIEMKDASTP